MPLIKCPECGKEVSDKAKVCPNCGNPFKRKFKLNHKIVKILITTVITIAILIGLDYAFAYYSENEKKKEVTSARIQFDNECDNLFEKLKAEQIILDLQKVKNPKISKEICAKTQSYIFDINSFRYCNNGKILAHTESSFALPCINYKFQQAEIDQNPKVEPVSQKILSALGF